MAKNEFQRRIARAEELGAQYSSAAEILRFYAAVARFQERFYAELAKRLQDRALEFDVESGPDAFARPFPSELAGRFNELIDVVESSGPDPLREAARELRSAGESMHLELLTIFWNGGETESPQPGPKDFFARAFLQPYAVAIRAGQLCAGAARCRICVRIASGNRAWAFCVRWARAGSVLCCVRFAWRNGIPRIVCPGCGEETTQSCRLYGRATQARARGGLRQLPDLHQDGGHDDERRAEPMWMRWPQSRSTSGAPAGIRKAATNLLQL